MTTEAKNIDFNDKSFFRKLASAIYKISEASVGLILTMYYAAKDPQTPKWAKSVIFLALAYFVMPLDSIPDLIPSLGYSDDLAALTSAFATVAAHIKEEHRIKAQKTLSKIFRK